MTALDWTIVLGFIAYAAFSGLRNRAIASQSLEEYFLAGRSLKGWQAGISMAATQFAADTPLLVTGLIATAGIFSLWRLWIYALAFLLMGFLLAPSWRRARVLTDAELTELRYGGTEALALRAIKAIYFGTVFNCAVLAMVLLAATRIAEPFLPWNEWLPSVLFEPVVEWVRWVGAPLTVSGAGALDPLTWTLSANNLLSILAIVTLTAFYSATGGLRSVVATDLVQFALAIISSLLFAWVVVRAAGGLDVIPEKIRQLSVPNAITGNQILAFTPTQAKDASLTVLAAFGLQWLVQMNSDGTGYLAQRTMACRSDRDARQAAVVFTVAQVLFRSLIWIPLGLGLLVLFPPALDTASELYAAEREFTFVRGISELLQPGLKGLMVAGMLAALASTVDSHLNWGSSYWTNDLYKRLVCESWLKREPSGRSLVWVARFSNLLILGLALFVMTRLSSIQTAWQISLLLGAGMGVILVLRWIWWRVTAWGELSTILASLVLAPLLLFGFPETSEALRLLIMAAGTTVAGVLMSLFGPQHDAERLAEFYRRAQPPGFWGPIARRCGAQPSEDLARLTHGLIATALAAFSIFSVLTGVGSWIADSPAPVWFPWQSIWIILNVALGLAIVPLWWRLAFQSTDSSGGAKIPG